MKQWVALRHHVEEHASIGLVKVVPSGSIAEGITAQKYPGRMREITSHRRMGYAKLAHRGTQFVATDRAACVDADSDFIRLADNLFQVQLAVNKPPTAAYLIAMCIK